ncbi:MAG: SAM-dependent methyltransferase [Robiginitomaculum sp.]|nr:MAG: SAM-dependent methyltransferase [Robiginitomaculum sp.]
MQKNEDVAKHYEHGNLLGAIENAIAVLGKTKNNVTIHDLAPVDEFHIGGRAASEHFLAHLAFDKNMHVLDIGCGLGGGARFTAKETGARVTGIDLTKEYIETGQVLSTWVNLEKQVHLQCENAMAMSFQDAYFDGAYMMHVGMNIEDKTALFNDVFRVLKTGAKFGIYDIMQTGAGNIAYPVPWAAGRPTSHLVSMQGYIEALEAAGFQIIQTENRRDFALDFFKKMKAKTQANGGPPPLGLHTLMQASTAEKITNMVGNISAGLIAPIEIIVHKP